MGDQWAPSDSESEGGRSRSPRPKAAPASRGGAPGSEAQSLSDEEGDVGVMLPTSVGVTDRPAPHFLQGTAWWATPLWNSLQHVALRMPARPKRAMTHESLCSGMMTERFGFKVVAGGVSSEHPSIYVVGRGARLGGARHVKPYPSTVHVSCSLREDYLRARLEWSVLMHALPACSLP